MIKPTAKKRQVTKSQSETNWTSREVDIRPLKDLAIEMLPENSPLRKVLLAERDRMSPYEFLAKMETWQYLLRIE
jgi:hypothetical protein